MLRLGVVLRGRRGEFRCVRLWSGALRQASRGAPRLGELSSGAAGEVEWGMSVQGTADCGEAGTVGLGQSGSVRAMRGRDWSGMAGKALYGLVVQSMVRQARLV